MTMTTTRHFSERTQADWDRRSQSLLSEVAAPRVLAEQPRRDARLGGHDGERTGMLVPAPYP